MLNCHKATQLMSESQERTLTKTEKLALKMHTLMCSGCRNFEKQLPTLRLMIRRFARGPGPDNGSDKDRK